MRGRFLAVVGITAGMLLAGAGAALPAWAHATLDRSDPAPGQRLAQPPRAVVLHFSEDVTFDSGYLRVLTTSGKEISTSAPQHPGGDATAVSVTLPAGLGDGGYIVSWRVISADSHPVGGAYSFAVGSAALPDAGATAAATTRTNPVVAAVFTASRWLGYAGIALLGVVVFLTVAWREGRGEPRLRALVYAGWVAATAGTAAGLLLQGPYGAGASLSRVTEYSLLLDTAHTTFGRLLAARLLLLGVLGLMLPRLLATGDGPVWPDEVAALLGVAILVTFAAAGHAATGSLPVVAVTADVLHLAAMVVWVGGLAAVAVGLGRRADAVATALPRFSTMAMVSVAVLAATGGYRAWQEIGGWDALVGTGYGRIVAVKIGLLAVLVLLGNGSRRWVRRLLAQAERSEVGGTPAATMLRRSVLTEVVIAATVLGFTAVLVNEAPARTTVVRVADASVRLPGGDQLRVSATPAHPGPNTVELRVTTAGGAAVAVQALSAYAQLPGTPFDRLPVALRQVGTGDYRGEQVALPAAGTWRVTVTVRLSEFDAYTVQAPITVR